MIIPHRRGGHGPLGSASITLCHLHNTGKLSSSAVNVDAKGLERAPSRNAGALTEGGANDVGRTVDDALSPKVCTTREEQTCSVPSLRDRSVPTADSALTIFR
jgi:hypothetical protein